MKKDCYTVFEAVNERRREVYVARTSGPMVEAIAGLRSNRPAALKAWDVSDITTVRSIEFDLTESEAADFIDAYLATALPAGWKYLR